MLEVKPRQVARPARSDPQAGLSIAEAARRTIEHKINVYRGGLAAGDADQPWAPSR